MNLSRKLEEIKQKPEHIRIRYVWVSVAISMFFIIIIWFFSMQSRVSSTATQDAKTTEDLQQQLDQIKNTTPSIDDLINTTNNAKQSLDSSSDDIQNQNANQQPSDQAAQSSQSSNQSQTSQNQNAEIQSQASSQPQPAATSNQTNNQPNNTTNQDIKGAESVNNAFPIAQ